MDEGARAHLARFDGDVEGGAAETVVTGSGGRIPQRGNLGMCGRVRGADRVIVTATDHRAVGPVHDDGADRDLAGGQGPPGFAQRLAHRRLVIHRFRPRLPPGGRANRSTRNGMVYSPRKRA